jgi:predicted RNA-binding Zn ribbon-like protein
MFVVNESEMLDAQSTPKFQFVGGDLSLDFCNTVGGKRGGIAREKLHSLNDFIAWAEQAKLLKPEQAEALRRFMAREPVESAELLTRATELREAIFRIFFSAAKEKKPAREDMARLNAELSASLGRLRIAAANDGDGFAWQWADEKLEPEHLLGPIARSAAELLVQPDMVAKIHQCEGDNCGWLFVDCSKNHSRRWCDMRDCGNRAKVRRHRKRHKS